MCSTAHGRLVLSYGVRTNSPTCMRLRNRDIWWQSLKASNMKMKKNDLFLPTSSIARTVRLVSITD
jgi:hypothetical protein